MVTSGLVPELTGEAARLASLGAGAKVVGVYAFQLTEDDLEEIQSLKPDIFLLVGGNIVIGKQRFEDVEKRFKDMGFDRAFPPGTAPETTIQALRELLHMDGEKQ